MTPSFPITAVILARNEAKNIERCVQSLAGCDEIVVVDDGSTDETCELAKRLGARVVQNRFQSFAKQRNWALEHAELRNAWSLMLDADEAATPGFLAEVAQKISQAKPDVVAYRTCRKTMLGKKWLRYSDEFPCWIMRVVRVGKAEFADSGHGEVPIPKLAGIVETIREPFIHYPFSHGLSQWLRRHVAYAEREAQLELSNASNVRLADLLSFDKSKRRRSLRALSRQAPMRGTLRFLYQYFLRGGFLDGREGYIFSMLKANYETMIIAKKWELEMCNQQSVD